LMLPFDVTSVKNNRRGSPLPKIKTPRQISRGVASTLDESGTPDSQRRSVTLFPFLPGSFLSWSRARGPDRPCPRRASAIICD
jgi:hypothetical protein